MKRKITPIIFPAGAVDRVPLPPYKCVTVEPGVLGVNFVDRVHSVLPGVSDWKFRSSGRHYHRLGKSLTLSYIGDSHEAACTRDLIVQIHGPEQGYQVELMFKAAEWNDNTFNFQNYVRIAQLFSSVMRAYNQSFRERLRMRIPSREDLEPSLTAEACVFFEWFLREAKERPYGCNAWRRLYPFIGLIESRRINLGEEDFFRLLELNGIPAEATEMYCAFYPRAIEMIRIGRRRPSDILPPELLFVKWCDIFNGNRSLAAIPEDV